MPKYRFRGRTGLVPLRSIASCKPRSCQEGPGLEPAEKPLGYLHLHQMADFIDHAADGRRVLMDHGVVQAAKAQGIDDPFLVPGFADGASGPGDLYLSHYLAAVSG